MRSRKDSPVFSTAAFPAAVFFATLAAPWAESRAGAGEASAAMDGKPLLDIDAEPMKSSPEELNHFDGKPYKIYPGGEVNFATYRGLNLYANLCHACHGQAGTGSSFGPSLVESLKYLSYSDFVEVVMRGRESISASSTKVMPSYGENKTVVKYIDSLYAYLRGRSDGDIPATDLEWKGPKTE